MLHLRSAAVLSVFSLVFIIGCGDKATGPGDSGLNPNAGALDNHSGNNAQVTDSVTAAKVGAIIQEQANNAVSNIFETMGDDGLSKRTSSTQSGTIESSINGATSGSAAVKGSYTLNQTNTQTKASIKVLCTFSNYSDSGDIYLGGQMNFEIEMTTDETSENTSMQFTVTGNIKFNGAYVGINTFTIEAEMGDNVSQEGSFTYNSTIVSNGVTTKINLTN